MTLAPMPYLRVPLIRRGIYLALFAGLLLALTELWFWAPARTAHAEARAEVITLQSELAVAEARIGEIDRYAGMQAMLDTLSTRFAAPIDRSGVVERLTALNTAAGTRIIHGANSFGEPRGGVTPVLQDLTVEGSFEQIHGFLAQLAELETLTLLRRAEFTANPDGSLVRVQLRLVTLSAGADG